MAVPVIRNASKTTRPKQTEHRNWQGVSSMSEQNHLKNMADTVLNENQQPAHDKQFCDNCGELLIFKMRDNYHDFGLGLTTVLQCLKVAENESYIPPLPYDWWRSVYYTHGIKP